MEDQKTPPCPFRDREKWWEDFKAKCKTEDEQEYKDKRVTLLNVLDEALATIHGEIYETERKAKEDKEYENLYPHRTAYRKKAVEYLYAYRYKLKERQRG